MEAVGAAASIIQLAGVGLALAKTLYSIYDAGASSNEQVKELSFYVRSTSIALEEVGRIFEEESRTTKPLISKNAITTANDVISRCADIFNKLGKMAEGAQKNTLGLLAFPLKSSRLQVLQTRLEQSKLDLQLMMQVIIYARLKIEPGYIVREPDQRKVVHKLIDEHVAIYERGHQVNNMAEPGSGGEPHRSSSSSLPSIPEPRGATGSPQSSCASDTNPLPPRPPQPLKRTLPAKNGSDQCKDRSYSGEARRPNPREADISYWAALYLVCCPCLVGENVRGIISGPWWADSPQPKTLCATRYSGYLSPVSRQSIYELGEPVRSIHSPDEDAHDVEVDRLLHQWTTIYDPPSIVIEESTLSVS